MHKVAAINQCLSSTISILSRLEARRTKNLRPRWEGRGGEQKETNKTLPFRLLLRLSLRSAGTELATAGGCAENICMKGFPKWTSGSSLDTVWQVRGRCGELAGKTDTILQKGVSIGYYFVWSGEWVELVGWGLSDLMATHSQRGDVILHLNLARASARDSGLLLPQADMNACECASTPDVHGLLDIYIFLFHARQFNYRVCTCNKQLTRDWTEVTFEGP